MTTSLPISVLTLLLSAIGAAAGADRSALQAACFPPAQLSARPGEQTPVKLAHAQNLRQPAWSPDGGSQPPAPRGAIRRVDLPAGRKLVALTFDLCETWGEIAGYDGGIVDYLRANGVRATFFGGGKWMTNHGDRTQQLMSDKLFALGSHGWAHRNIRGLSGLPMIRELTGPSVAYRQQREALAARQCAAGNAAAISAIPPEPTLYRFPFGACKPEALDAVAQAGMLAIQWDVSAGDATPSQSGRAIAESVTRHVRPGSIVLMHANGRGYHTGDALPLIVPALRAKGYEFVTVPELIAAGKPVVVDTCFDEHPGDTDKYDALFAPSARTNGWSTTARPPTRQSTALP